MKVVSELIDKGQKQVNSVETPLIQINQQNNEVNVGDSSIRGGLSRDSRERVKNTVTDLLASLGLTGMPTANNAQPEVHEAEYVEVVDVEDTEEDDY